MGRTAATAFWTSMSEVRTAAMPRRPAKTMAAKPVMRPSASSEATRAAFLAAKGHPAPNSLETLVLAAPAQQRPSVKLASSTSWFESLLKAIRRSLGVQQTSHSLPRPFGRANSQLPMLRRTPTTARLSSASGSSPAASTIASNAHLQRQSRVGTVSGRPIGKRMNGTEQDLFPCCLLCRNQHHVRLTIQHTS